MNKIDLTKLSKEELISIIANMHDSIIGWHHECSYGYEKNDPLKIIGESASNFCNENNNWELPIIEG